MAADITRLAESINILGAFCGMRDVPELTPAALSTRWGIQQADVMVLFGGSIIAGGDVLAEAMKNGAARHYIISGGAGHTTETLRTAMHSAYPAVTAAGLPEAQVFALYLKYRYGLVPDLLECRSTNCGNNITFLLELLEQNGITFDSIILTQDASMQRRMDAGLRKYISPDVKVINYAAAEAKVTVKDGKPVFVQTIPGMWTMERYIMLLLGEIPRLTDNADGYGPRGKNYIAHVDIPDKVIKAFDCLKNAYPDLIRTANPQYAAPC